MSSLQGTELAFSFNFLFSRELVIMTVNTPVQERNATCRIVGSAESFKCLTCCNDMLIHFAYQDGGIAMVAMMR